MLVSTDSPDPWLERIKAEIRDEAAAARQRTPLPRIEPRVATTADPAPAGSGIEPARLDYVIADLTGADYGAFIDHAFRSLLKREPDPAGAGEHLRRLIEGAPKAEILGDLRWSGEGRRIGARVRGLLPRYLLAKFTRVPVLGFVVDWGLALAGLPVLMRHQRAMDTVNAARFSDLRTLQRDCQTRFAGHEAAQQALASAQQALVAELQRGSAQFEQQLAQLQQRADALARTIEAEAQASTGELTQLRHEVHATHHWLASLQQALAALDEATAQAQAREDALAAAVGEDVAAQAQRSERQRAWSALLATRLGTGTRVLDLGSGAGTWLRALAAAGLVADGVEANAQLVARGRQDGTTVALGAPLDALTRCADAGVAALTVSASLLDGREAVTRLLDEARRALAPGAWLLLRVEDEPQHYRVRLLDARSCAALLAAAGFVAAEVVAGHGGSAVLARQP